MKSFLSFLSEERIKNKNAKINILAIQGSARNEKCCPDHESKSYRLLKNAIKDRKDVLFDVVDLSVQCDGNIVQPCKACISTAGGIHCHFPCSCYSKNNKKIPDLMYNENVYEKLEKCDGFVVFSPINWDAPSSVVKSFFDRLVCCNLTLSLTDAKKILGEDLKNSEKTRPIAKSGEYNHLLKNHLEGKFAAFFIQGDNGADDYKNIKKPDSYLEYTKNKNMKTDPVECIEPIVKQLVYSGIYVKENCVDGLISGFGTDYPTNDDNLEQELFKRSRKVVDNLISEIFKNH
jgi:multimeric flavodoxin WrbA